MNVITITPREMSTLTMRKTVVPQIGVAVSVVTNTTRKPELKEIKSLKQLAYSEADQVVKKASKANTTMQHTNMPTLFRSNDLTHPPTLGTLG